LYDNAPMTVIESMSCGTPVVGTSAGGTKEYVLHEQCGLIVPPADVDALAQALAKLASDKDLRERMSATCRARVMEHFTIEKTAGDTLKLYEKAVNMFVERHTALYPGEPESLSADLNALIDSFERTMYDMTYSNSWRFRINHWRKRAKQ